MTLQVFKLEPEWGAWGTSDAVAMWIEGVTTEMITVAAPHCGSDLSVQLRVDENEFFLQHLLEPYS